MSFLLLLFSGGRQASGPIAGFDDRMYHASRVAYWVQNQSILQYPTHNERQVAFPFGSELFFLWGVLFSKWEVLGRVLFWMGFPLAVVAIHVVAGAVGIREPYRSLAGLLFVSTPIVASMSLGLAPEYWLAVFELGMAFWLITASSARDPKQAAPAAGWAGMYLLLALNVKTTAVGLLLPAMLLPLFVVRRGGQKAAWRALTIGAVSGFFLSGLAVNAVSNVVRCGNPFASAGLRRIVRSDFNVRQVYIHAVRFPFLLLEAPWIPDPLRGQLEASGESLAEKLGATRAISLEDSTWPWPGRFRFSLPQAARNYSIGGLFWLPGLACGLFVVLRQISQRRRLAWSSPILLCTALALSSLVPVVFGLRWMAGSEVPVRFLVAPWALGVVLLSALASRGSAGGRVLPVLAFVVVAAQVLAAARTDWVAIRGPLRTPLPKETLDEPFAGLMKDLPPGSRILLFAEQDTRDYPLFRPREGFPNCVFAWGDEAPTPGGVARRAHAAHATHVLFVAGEWLSRHWGPPVRVAETIAGLVDNPDFHEISTATPGMRLFAVVQRSAGK